MVTCVALLALATLWYASASREEWYETATGEQRVVALTDGSRVALNTGTRIGVELGSHERLVRLERGEALFEVARDAQRPFIVNAATGYARAVGTRFNVQVDAGAVTVVVLEGRVEVAPSPAERVHAARLTAGESAAFVASGSLAAAAPERASIERIAAWRDGKLRFDAWPLEQAIAEHNRYAHKPIVIDGNVPDDVKVSGVFRIGDTQALLGALQELLDVTVVDAGESFSLVMPPRA
jgi:transmembrane sensor